MSSIVYSIQSLYLILDKFGLGASLQDHGRTRILSKIFDRIDWPKRALPNFPSNIKPLINKIFPRLLPLNVIVVLTTFSRLILNHNLTNKYNNDHECLIVV